MEINSKKIGELGEKIAEKFLKKKGYKILDKNYISRFVTGPQRGEIDIIAKKGDLITFFEVKTLQDKGFFIAPEEKVDSQKRRKIEKMMESWLIEKKIPFETPWQIDIVAIRIDLKSKKARINHFKNIF
jgi:putative endonuclease